MNKKLLYVGIVAYICALLVAVLALPISAITEYSELDYTFVAGRSTPPPSSTITYTYSRITFTVNNDTDKWYNRMTYNVSSGTVTSITCQNTTQTTWTYVITNGDVVHLSAPVGNMSTSQRDSFNHWFDAVAVWVSDDSSPFAQMYSTISHYVFGDDFTNVPYGDMWCSCVAVIGCILVVGMPFVVVWFVLRRV